MTERRPARSLPVYNASTASATPAQTDGIQTQRSTSVPARSNFLGDTLRAVPVRLLRARSPTRARRRLRARGPGQVALSRGFTSGPNAVDRHGGTQLHELAHQWFGNSVTLAQWNDIWFNEGWAQLERVVLGLPVGRATDEPGAIFADLYANTPDVDWALAPAVLGGDPANLFDFFPTYQRGAMTLEGYREIVGDQRVLRLRAGDLHAELRPRQHLRPTSSSPSRSRRVGFSGAKLALLDDYFQQWLYGETKPTIVPGDFS